MFLQIAALQLPNRETFAKIGSGTISPELAA